MSIVIIKPGLLDTIQNLGRTGNGNYTISTCGAMDHFAAKMANIITGNSMNENLLEIHFPGPQLLFEQDALISITGADLSPRLNDEPLPNWQTILVRKNTVLQFSGVRQGVRAYLAVHGGFAIERILNNNSINLKAVAGGWQGRKLQKGDVLNFRQGNIRIADLFNSIDNFQLMPWRPDIGTVYNDMNKISFIKGNEWDELSIQSKHDLTESNFIIYPSSDRMGYQLKGTLLSGISMKEMVSGDVCFGTIQLLPDGKIEILMADHQTTGRYPRIGHVISAHLPKLAQLSPGNMIQFKLVDIHAAEKNIFTSNRNYKYCTEPAKTA